MRKINTSVKFILPLISSLTICSSSFLASCYHSDSNANETNPNNKTQQNNQWTSEESNSNILFNERVNLKPFIKRLNH